MLFRKMLLEQRDEDHENAERGGGPDHGSDDRDAGHIDRQIEHARHEVELRAPDRERPVPIDRIGDQDHDGKQRERLQEIVRSSVQPPGNALERGHHFIARPPIPFRSVLRGGRDRACHNVHEAQHDAQRQHQQFGCHLRQAARAAPLI
jgi:hypothetical protein